MNKTKVFQHHLDHLRIIIPDAPSVFVCPICLDIFAESNLAASGNGQDPLLSDGHVWNKKYVGKFTDKDFHNKIFFQRVLLCKNCNSLSGEKNEAALKDFEDFRLIKKSGGYKSPKAFVKSKHGSIDPGRIEFSYDARTNRIRYDYPKDPKGNPLYNPKDKKALHNFIQQGSCSEPFIWYVKEDYNASEKWQKAQAALITSAYLQLFFKYGYYYIFNKQLAPVRDYIKQSFGGTVDSRLDPSPEKSISVGVCGQGHHYPEPKIMVSPPNNDRFQHVEVNFNDYHMRLPFPADHLEAPELCEDCGEETGEVSKHIVLDAPDNEIIDTVSDKLKEYR